MTYSRSGQLGARGYYRSLFLATFLKPATHISGVRFYVETSTVNYFYYILSLVLISFNALPH